MCGVGDGVGVGVGVTESSKSSSIVAPVVVIAIAEFAVVAAFALLDEDGGSPPGVGVGSARLL